MGKLFIFSVPQFFHQQNGDNKSIYLPEQPSSQHRSSQDRCDAVIFLDYFLPRSSALPSMLSQEVPSTRDSLWIRYAAVFLCSTASQLPMSSLPIYLTWVLSRLNAQHIDRMTTVRQALCWMLFVFCLRNPHNQHHEAGVLKF